MHVDNFSLRLSLVIKKHCLVQRKQFRITRATIFRDDSNQLSSVIFTRSIIHVATMKSPDVL